MPSEEKVIVTDVDKLADFRAGLRALWVVHTQASVLRGSLSIVDTMGVAFFEEEIESLEDIIADIDNEMQRILIGIAGIDQCV